MHKGLTRAGVRGKSPTWKRPKSYLAQGGYYWNSGMFVMRASRWLAALGQFRSDIAEATRKSWDVRQGRCVRAPGKSEFVAVPSESVDYAVMEQCPAKPESGFVVRMVPLDAGWSDLGAWDAVWQVSEHDAAGNAAHGDVLMQDTQNTLVHATSRLVSTVGLDNIVVVETPDAVLVADRSRSQDVKKIVEKLGGLSRSEGTLHRRVHRP